MILILTCIAITLVLGLVIVGPVLGFRFALAYLFERFCGHVPFTDDDITAWDYALQDGHETSTTGIWFYLFGLDTDTATRADLARDELDKDEHTDEHANA